MNYIRKNELFLLEELVKKNFSSKYKDSVLGILWTILNPLLIMALFTIIFSTLFGRNIENFPVYFLCGKCVFDFFNGIVSGSMYSLKSNKNILQRTPVPKYVFILAGALSEALNFLITLILLIGVMIVTNAPFYGTIIFSIIPVFFLFIMSTGFGLILSVMSVYYSDIQHLWSVILLMLFYSSAIFFPMDIIPEPFHQFMILNPIFWAIDQFRYFIYYGVFPQAIYMFNLALLSLIILLFGIIIFKKYEKNINIKL